MTVTMPTTLGQVEGGVLTQLMGTALISGFSWCPVAQKWVPARSYQKVLGVLKKEKGPF